jgi:hypothetical protein
MMTLLQVYVFRTFPAEKVQSKILESSAAAAAAVSAATAVAAPSLVNGKSSSSSPDTQETVVELKELSETVQDSMAVKLPTEESEVPFVTLLFRHLQLVCTIVSWRLKSSSL